MGDGAVAFALASTPDGSYAIVGCDPIGMTALISLDNTGLKDRLVAVDKHTARRTLASKYAATTLSNSEPTTDHQSDVVIAGAIREFPGFNVVNRLVKPDGAIIFSEPYGSARASDSGLVFQRIYQLLAPPGQQRRLRAR